MVGNFSAIMRFIISQDLYLKICLHRECHTHVHVCEFVCKTNTTLQLLSWKLIDMGDCYAVDHTTIF